MGLSDNMPRPEGARENDEYVVTFSNSTFVQGMTPQEAAEFCIASVFPDFGDYTGPGQVEVTVRYVPKDGPEQNLGEFIVRLAPEVDDAVQEEE